jgi:hypothetical protein
VSAVDHFVKERLATIFTERAAIGIGWSASSIVTAIGTAKLLAIRGQARSSATSKSRFPSTSATVRRVGPAGEKGSDDVVLWHLAASRGGARVSLSVG